MMVNDVDFRDPPVGSVKMINQAISCAWHSNFCWLGVWRIMRGMLEM